MYLLNFVRFSEESSPPARIARADRIRCSTSFTSLLHAQGRCDRHSAHPGSLTHQHHPAMPAAGEVRSGVFCALLVAVLSSAGPDAPPVTTARKIGVRRELSTVDLNQDLAVPADLRSPPVKSQPVFRANSFVSADPRSGTDEPGLRTQHGAPGPAQGHSPAWQRTV